MANISAHKETDFIVTDITWHPINITLTWYVNKERQWPVSVKMTVRALEM